MEINDIHVIQNKKRPLVEIIDSNNLRNWDYFVSEPIILFVIKGSLKIYKDNHLNSDLTKDYSILLTPGQMIHCAIEEFSTIVSFRLDASLDVWDRYINVNSENSLTVSDTSVIKINKKLKHFLNDTISYFSDSIRCKYVHKIRINEFFFILKTYYNKNLFTLFLSPLTNAESQFYYHINRKSEETKNTQELARLCNYSLSVFNKKFNKIFGLSASDWMKNKMIKMIKHDIHHCTKPIKTIIEEYEFSSINCFNDFCLTHFGSTPDLIRTNIRSQTDEMVKKLTPSYPF